MLLAPQQSSITTTGAAAVFTSRQRLVLLATFTLLVAFRLPGAWVRGRFLDEEATVFLAYAWHHPALDALFRPFAGYLNIGATATTVLAVQLVKAGVLPLERAPYLTMLIALAVQLLPAVLTLTGRATWLTDRRAVVAALLVIALAPASEEVFFNVLHIQFHLALCAGLILALDLPQRRLTRFGYGALLFLAPLCGPGAIVILPLFAARALLDRDRARFMQLASFAAGTAVQMLLFYGASPMRGHLQGPGAIAAALLVRLAALPALNFGSANRIGDVIFQSQQAGGHGWWIAVILSLLLFGGLIALALRRRDAAIWLLLSSFGIAAASFGFGMVMLRRSDLFTVDMGERYNFLPLVLLGFGLIVIATRGGRSGRVCGWLCVLMLLTGAIRYPVPEPMFNTGPPWPAEVAAWRRDHRHPVEVWPLRYYADLSDETRTCTGRPTDPRFCESGWVAGFAEGRDPDLR